MTKATMEKFKVPESKCPHCGHVVDGASHAGGGQDNADHTPKPGDLSVCIRCAGLSTYGPDMQLVALTLEQFSALPAEVKYDIARAKIALGIATAICPEDRPK